MNTPEVRVVPIQGDGQCLTGGPDSRDYASSELTLGYNDDLDN